MDISLGVVDSLVLLVEEGVLCSSSTGGKVGVVVLGDLLVDLL